MRQRVPSRRAHHLQEATTVNHQLDPSAVISRAFNVYLKNAAVLLPIAIGIYVIQVLLAIVVGDSIVGALVASLLSLVFVSLLTGIVVEVARDVEDGVLDSSIGQLIAAVVPVILPLIIVSILAGLAVGIGFIFLIVPGLFLATILAVVAPVTVLERPGVFAAFGRSQALVKGHGWQVFALILFNFVLQLVAGGIGGIPGDTAGVVFTGILSAIVAPLSALIIAIAYLRLREAHGEAPLPTGVATADGPESRQGF